MDDYGPTDWEWLDRYLSGATTADERERIERRLANEPQLAALLEAMRSIGRPPGAPSASWDPNGAWERMREQMRERARPRLRVVSDSSQAGPAGVPDPKAPASQPRASAAGSPRGRVGRSARHSRSGWRRLAKVAAITLVVGSAGLFVHRRSHDRAVELPDRSFTSERGQRSVVTLPDGSRVILAPETRLRVPGTYAGDAGPRDLHLEGQAHFTVEDALGRPFRVHTGLGVAEDRGTEFVVTAYPETDGMEVFVTSGLVALHEGSAQGSEDGGLNDSEPLAILGRGDLARLDSAGTATLSRAVDLASRTAWVEGRVVFDGTPLGEAVPTLERWYDVEIELADPSLGSRRLTADYGGEPLSSVLKLIALSLELEVRRDGPSIVLARRTAAPGGD